MEARQGYGNKYGEESRGRGDRRGHARGSEGYNRHRLHTAAQVISEISKTAGHLTIFQRTPQWVLGVPDKIRGEHDKATLRGNQPLMDKLRERYAWLMRNTFTEAVSSGGWRRALLSWRVKRHLRKSVLPAGFPELLPDAGPQLPGG